MYGVCSVLSKVVLKRKKAFFFHSLRLGFYQSRLIKEEFILHQCGVGWSGIINGNVFLGFWIFRNYANA